MKINKKVGLMQRYVEIQPLIMFDIEDVEDTAYLSFRLDINEYEIENYQKRGLVFDYYQDGLFYIKLNGGVNRGVIKF